MKAEAAVDGVLPVRTERNEASTWECAATWDGSLPLAPVPLDEAQAFCERLARTHYENFHVASLLLPLRLRPHFYSIYAYCRWSDDLGDEIADAASALRLLDLWEQELDACYDGRARHPIFVALRETIVHCHIPPEPFRNLLTAFRRDQVVKRYATFAELLDYCRYSANPVGRLVLYACGYRDPQLQQLSDFTCTALQLANFWQDVRRDYAIGRIYIPLETMDRFGYSERELAAAEYNERFAAMLRELVESTWQLFRRGLPLADRVDRRLGIDIELFSRGGMEILRLIERQNYNVLARRPTLDKFRMGMLLASTILRRMRPFRKPDKGARL